MLERFYKQVSIQKAGIVLILLGLALLLIEIRYEHQVVLGKKWQAWIPIVYTSSMMLLGGIGLKLWDRGGRKALSVGFSAAVLVGLAGFWFHSKGHVIAALCHVVMVVCMAPGRVVLDSGGPPVLAPLAFIGLGLLGLLLSLGQDASLKEVQETVK